MIGIRKIGINTHIFGMGRRDTTAPVLSAVEVGAVADNKITLTYDENLDTGSVAATGDYSLVGSALATISSVGVAGPVVTLTLSGDIYDFEIIKLSYTAGTNPIRDVAGNNAANLTSEAVTNNGNASCTLDGETLDYSDLSLTSAQVDSHIEGLSTCTNCVIDISGTNDHRTAASNDDLNTLLANGNTITLNDVLGDELHTSLNAANDSATQAITAFSDYSGTIDGATKVETGAVDFLSMIPQGAELIQAGNCANADYTTFGGSPTPTGFTATSNGGASHRAGTADEISYVNEKRYIVKFDLVLNSGTAPFYRPRQAITSGEASVEGNQLAVAGANVFMFTCNWTGTGVITFNNASTATDFEVTNISVKELEVLGSDLVTDGDFTSGADLNVSDCVNVGYDAFSGAAPDAFNAAHTTSGTQIAGTADEMSFVNGQKYTVTFDMVLNSGQKPHYNLHENLAGTVVTDDGYQEADAGANSFEFTANATTTGVLQFYSTQNSNYEITNLSVKDSDTAWTLGDGWSIAGGVASCDGSQVASSYLYQTGTVGDAFSLWKFTISNYSAGGIRCYQDGDHLSSDFTANGTYSVLMENDGYGNTIAFRADADFIGSIDNVSVMKLLDTKTIAGSTNYNGSHYYLPVDANDWVIPFTYAAEGIVSQVFTAESNLTTNLTVANNALITSVDTPVNVGNFALNVESNTTPTADADCDMDITVENAAVYRLSVDHRHVGSGDDWILEVEGTTADTLANTETTYATKVYYFTAGDTTCTIRYKENNIANDGGVVFDNLSLKKVTLS